MELANEFEFQHFQPHLVLSKVVFDRICRTCLSVTDTTLIFEVTHGSIKLNEILKDVASIQAKEDDNLPKCICLSCRNLLIQLYTFKQKVQRAELLLQTVLVEGNAIKEDVDLNTEPVVMPERIDEFTVKVEVENVHIKEENLRLHYCNYCNKQFDSISDLQSHSCTVNEDEDLDKTVFPGMVVLPFDTKNFEKSVKKRKSKKGCVKEKKSTAHICKPCNKEFDTLSELKLHKKQVKHPTPRNHGCAECGKTFSHKNLIEHMRTHTKEKPFCCPLCSKQFSLKCNLRRHMMTHSGERPYKCDVCDRGFARAGTLKHHKRTHTGETPYVCNYCGLSFGQSLKHKNHLRSHLANREEGSDKIVDEVFECNICNHSFTTKGGLKTHMLTHGEKTFLCSHCGKCFVSKSYLLSHSKTHTGVKPYSCSVCNKSFSDSSTLRSHVLIHTGEKPFVCKVCLKGFTQRTHLKNHMRTHTGEKPYSCMYCGKTFKLKGHLTVHIRMHTGETPYSCDKCDRGFSDYSGMAKHKRIHIKTEESS